MSASIIQNYYFNDGSTFTGDTVSACTAVYTNKIISCSGDTNIELRSNGVYIDGDLTANTINVSTYYSGGTNLLDIISNIGEQISGGTFDSSSKTLTLNKVNNSSVVITGFTDSDIDTVVTGGTYTDGVILFTNNTGGTFSVSGFFTGTTDVYVTGGTYSNGTALFTNNTGGTFSISGFNSQDLNITGGTADNSSKQYTFTNNTGGTFTVNGLTDLVVTGGTLTNGTITFTNNTGGTFSVSGFTTGDTIITSGNTYISSGNTYITSETTDTFGVAIDGQGFVISTGITGTLIINYNCTITGWTLFETSNTPISSSIVIDVWKTTYDNYPPVVANSIFGTKPSLTSNIKNKAEGLSVSVSAGDIFRFNVESISGAKLLKFNLLVTK